MATISKPFTFTVGATIIASEHNSNFDTIYNEFNGSIDNSNIKASAAIVDTKLAQIATVSKVSGAALTSLTSIPSGAGIIPIINIGAASWTNYAATSTVTGWSSFTDKVINYKVIGNTVFAMFFIAGTSNAVTVSFTLPYSAVATTQFYGALGTTQDNGTTKTTPGQYVLYNNNILNCFSDMAGATWTNSGTKSAVGQFWYESA